MKLAMMLPAKPDLKWTLARRVGVEYAVTKAASDLSGLPPPWEFDSLRETARRFEEQGFRLCALEGDEFDFYENETGLHFDFKPSLTAPHSYDTFKLVYLVARLKDGGMVFVYMSRNEVDAIRSRSQSKDRSGNPIGPWRDDYLAMAEKTIIRRACNRGMLPMSVEMGTALANDDAKPVVLDEEGYEVLANMPNAVPAEVPENVDPETGEIVDDAAQAADAK